MKTPQKKISMLFYSFGVTAIRSVVVTPNECQSVAPEIAPLGFPSPVVRPFGLLL